MHLRRVCILLVLDAELYKCQLSPSGLMCQVRLCFLADFLWGVKRPPLLRVPVGSSLYGSGAVLSHSVVSDSL